MKSNFVRTPFVLACRTFTSLHFPPREITTSTLTARISLQLTEKQPRTDTFSFSEDATVIQSTTMAVLACIPFVNKGPAQALFLLYGFPASSP